MHVYGYDATGNWVERVYYRDTGTLSNTGKYTHTKNGDLASESGCYASSIQNYAEMYWYDEADITAEEYRTAAQLIELIITELFVLKYCVQPLDML